MFRAKDEQGKWTAAWERLVRGRKYQFLQLVGKFVNDEEFGRASEKQLEVWVVIQRTIKDDPGIINKSGYFLDHGNYQLTNSDWDDDQLTSLNSFGCHVGVCKEPQPFALLEATKVGPKEIWLITLVKKYCEKDILDCGYICDENQPMLTKLV